MGNITKRLVVIVTQLLLVTPAMMWGQWVRQDTPPDITILLSVDFVSDSVGAAGGWAFDPDVAGRGIYTTDGGSTWSMSQIPDSSRALVRFQFIDGDTGYMVGAYNLPQQGSAGRQKMIDPMRSLNYANPIEFGRFLMGISLDSTVETRGLFLKTTDGGKSWSTKGAVPDSVDYLVGSSFLDMNLGYVTGSAPFSAGIACILKTTDGGASWMRLSIPDSINELRSIAFRDSLLGVAVGYRRPAPFTTGIILRTTNGGIDWQTQSYSEVGNFTDVCFIDSSVCLAVGVSGYDGLPPGGMVYLSIDAGLNWAPLPYIPAETFLYGISFLPGTGTGIILGAKLSGPAAPFIARTTDQGDTWTETILSVDSGGILVGGNMMSPLVGFACGSGGAENGRGYMIHTDDGGLVGVRESGDQHPPGSGLSQNYPNPFNPSTQIAYTLPSASTVSLNVFDILGQEVATLINERQEAGEYRIEWKAEGFPGGVYFYRLVVGGYVGAKKMVLLK